MCTSGLTTARAERGVVLERPAPRVENRNQGFKRARAEVREIEGALEANGIEAAQKLARLVRERLERDRGRNFGRSPDRGWADAECTGPGEGRSRRSSRRWVRLPKR